MQLLIPTCWLGTSTNLKYICAGVCADKIIYVMLFICHTFLEQLLLDWRRKHKIISIINFFCIFLLKKHCLTSFARSLACRIDLKNIWEKHIIQDLYLSYRDLLNILWTFWTSMVLEICYIFPIGFALRIKQTVAKYKQTSLTENLCCCSL